MEKKHFSLTIFFSETIAPRRTGLGSLERARHALYAHIFFVQIGPIGANTQENRSWVIGKGSSRPVRTYFFRPDRTNRSQVITEPSYNGLKVTKEKKHFSLTIFFSETIGPRRTGPGSLERTRRALYAHIFFFQIGPIGADTQENRTGVVGKGSSRPLRPYFFLPHRTNRSRVITHPGEPVWGHWKGLVGPCTHIFFSSRSDQQEPSYNGLKGTKEKNIHLGEPDRGNKGKKHFPLTIFFSETIAPRRTGPGSLERARRAPYAHIFFVQIGPIGADTQENRTGVVGKGSSGPLRPYFFLPDWTNRSRVITKNLSGVIGKDSSRPLRPYFFRPDRTNRSQVITDPGEPVRAPRRTGLGSLERARRALYAHIFFVQIGPIGAKVQRRKTLYLTIFFSETVAPRRTRPGSLERTRRALYAHIFFFQIGPIGADTQENRTGVVGKGSSRPLRPYFFLPHRTNRSRVITHPGEPVWGHWKGLVGPCTHIFFSSRSDQQEPSYNGLKGTKEKNIHLGEPDRGNKGKKHFPLTIFFSETIAPRRTGPGSLERARRALYAHIFFVQIGPIGAETQENPSGVIGKDSSRPLRPYFFLPDWTNRSRVITKNLNGVIGKDSSRPLRPYFFLPDRTNRSRVITHPGEPVWGHWKGLVGPCTHIFFSSRSDQQEPSYNGLKGTKEKNIHLGEPDRGNKGKKHFPLTIFFSETIAPRRTGPGSLERARRALYAHIFFVQIGPIGAETQENPSGVIGKDSSRPLRPYFFLPGWTNRSRVITKNLNGVIGKDSSRPLRPYFFLPDRTNRSRVITHPGEPVWGHWKGLVGPCTHIFFSSRSDQQEPSYNGLKGTKEKNIGSLERARRALYAHIFFVQIGPIGADTQENRTGVVGKGSSGPLRPYFFLPDWTNRSRVITKNLSGVIGKDSSRPLRPYFLRPDRTNRSQVITDPGEPVRGHCKGLVAPSTPIFFSSSSDQ
ncbi:hypothetical protein V1477_017853 [Vespula maculifrons]|uniref:Ribosomal protein S3 n=1 Tax=Vespula maculifrons TaxID=7453 RepID=A0ABD2AZK4_VESMC